MGNTEEVMLVRIHVFIQYPNTLNVLIQYNVHCLQSQPVPVSSA
jgi:hypothetical protein